MKKVFVSPVMEIVETQVCNLCAGADSIKPINPDEKAQEGEGGYDGEAPEWSGFEDIYNW